MLDLDPDPLRELSDALLGQVLPGSEGRRYPLRERIGEGGQGWVFRATWNGSVDVVVKVLRPDATSADALARFQREAEVLRTLSQQPSPNPHLVRFFDHAYARVQVGSTSKLWDLPFTVLELVDGETLEQALERAHPHGIGLERARRILRHVVLALQDVHARNIVHRDLKPSNILLATPGGREIAKVTDFGLAKLLDPGMQRTTTLAGATVGYAPPEQFENGNLRVGPQTDVFSLAAVFYELVTGAPAFPYHPNAHPLMVIVRILSEARPAFARVPEKLPRELAERPDVVAAVDAELSRALSPEPGDRHPTVMDLFGAIERALASLGSTPSIPNSRAAGGVVVHASARPGEQQELGIAATMQAESPASDKPVVSTAPALPLVRVPGRSVSETPVLGWRVITGPLLPGAFTTIAVAAAGGRAVGLGPRGPAQWKRGHWTSLDLPEGVDPGAMRAAAWLGDRLLLAGASLLVISVESNVAPTTWRLESPGLAFHGVFADEVGIVLAGERATSSGVVGVIAEIPLVTTSGPSWRTVDVPGTGPLRAATRLGASLLACGDGGALVSVRGAEPPRVVRVCEPALTALLPLPDGTAVAVGGGGFVYRVSPTLEAQLGAIQTTRDLFAVARGPDGTLWCAGAAGRVLRCESRGWVRVGAEGAEGRVRALHASGHRLLAFCDDGAVLEGVAK